MPETNEGIQFDELGICQACRSSEEKMHIDWIDRGKILKNLLDEAKASANGRYDCIVPVSGGKDSVFQLHVLKKIHGMNPLTVTHSHNWYSEVGWYNLWNSLERLDVDHVMYTPKRGLVNRLARRSLTKIGDACWHCHSGIYSFPLHMAVKFGIPLLIYGESPSEFSGRATYAKPIPFGWGFEVEQVSRKLPDEMLGDDIRREEMMMYRSPSPEACEKAGVRRLFLGDYMFWDYERQTEFVVKEYGWKEDDVEGTYKRYKSVECRMTGVHDWMKFVKRGFGRGTDFASADVRAGLLTRAEGFELAKKHDAARPKSLDFYKEITGWTEEEILAALRSLREGKAKELP